MTQLGFTYSTESPRRIEVQLRSLRPGAQFIFPIWGTSRERRGKVLYVNSCRAYVELFGEPKVREFTTAKGSVVRFTDTGNKKVSWCPECLVEIEQNCVDYASEPCKHE